MSKETLKMPSYGGQALIEGILMRGKSNLAVAMRAPDGSIVIQKERLQGIYTSKFTKIPFLRGLVLLWDAFGLGIRYLTISANTQTGEDEKIEGASLIFTVIFSLAIAVGLFFLAPAGLVELLDNFLNISTFASNLLEGLLRLLLIVGYIWGVGFMPDIRRVFSYHGAEHKTINAFEAGVELTVENVQKHSVQHPRCGTAFILTLVVFSIILFSIIGPLPPVWRIASRVLLLPLLAMLAYEYIRFTSKISRTLIGKALAAPNLALQNLTTRQPTDQMVEVALAAFNTMLAEEQKDAGLAEPIT